MTVLLLSSRGVKRINVYKDGELLYSETTGVSSFSGFRQRLFGRVMGAEFKREDNSETEIVEQGHLDVWRFYKRSGYYAELQDGKGNVLFTLFFDLTLNKVIRTYKIEIRA